MHPNYMPKVISPNFGRKKVDLRDTAKQNMLKQTCRHVSCSMYVMSAQMILNKAQTYPHATMGYHANDLLENFRGTKQASEPHTAALSMLGQICSHIYRMVFSSTKRVWTLTSIL